MNPTLVAPNYDIGQVILGILISYQIPTLLGLMIIDWLTGILAGLRKGQIQLPALADFYLTNIIPYLGGYIIFATALRYLPLTGLEQFPVGGTDLARLFESLGTNLGFGVIVVAVGTSIFRNTSEIYTGSPLWRDIPTVDEDEPDDEEVANT